MEDEAHMEGQVHVDDVTGGRIGASLVAEIVRRAAPQAGHAYVIAIDGRSGAGKSSLAAVLQAELGTGAAVVALEDLYGGWNGLERGIDLLVSEVLEPLSAGQAARVPRYDWGAGVWGTPWVLEPPAMLIVEGVGAGARRAAAYANQLIWIAAPASVRKKRALDRDGETFAPYWDMWAAQEDAMLAREHTPARAGLVITACGPDTAPLCTAGDRDHPSLHSRRP
jgi:para-aminobenzoate synthetase